MAQPTAQSIAQRILAALKVPESFGATGGEGFVFGDPATSVDRVVVCRAPTVAVLKQLPATGRTLLVTREDPLYRTADKYGGGSPSFIWSAGLADALKDNPITSIKQTMMAERGVVVYRLSAAWDSAQPSSNSDALARALGLNPVRGPDPSTAYAAAPVATLEELARFCRDKLQVRTVRISGQRTAKVSRLATMSGLVSLPRLSSALRDPRVDGVIVGETCEWEATPYLQDLISSGRRLGMVLVGYAASDNHGLPAVRDFVKNTVPGMSVTAAEDTTEPSWMDQRGA